MSVYQGTNLIAGGRQCMPLLSFMWADHQLNDISWLRADTFSWQSGSVYVAVYSHLTDDISGKSLQSETISGTTVQFYVADDGHKICPASEESNVAAIYAATGVAWYYILDTVNQRFKLPRTQFGVTGLRDTVGKYVEAGLPNITGSYTSTFIIAKRDNSQCIGAISSTVGNGGNFGSSGADSNWGYGFNFDASRSSSIYGNSTTVQPPATQMYLYFYVGSFTQTALENTAGLNASLFNGKADLDLSNITASAMSMLFTAMLPDYSAGVSMAANVTHTATENGWVHFYQFNSGDRWFYIDGNQFKLGAGNGSPHYSGNAILVPISKGQTFMGNDKITFFPCRN